MPKTLEVIVSPNGETTVRTRGYTGSDCAEATRALERELGLVVRDQQTAEFYQTSTSQQQNLSQ